MLDGGMRSPWEENSRKTERNDMFQGEQGNEFLGQLLQRSTSAPPLPSETNDAIGGQQDEEDTESFLFGRGRQKSAVSRFGLFDTSGRDTAPALDTRSFIPGYEKEAVAGKSTAPGLYSSSAFDEPIFGTRNRSSLLDDEDGHDDNAFLFNPQLMPRSHSAAPTLRESKSLGPPPGYEMNRTNASDVHNATAGLQRSASTGVIGGRQKTSSSVLRSLMLDSEGDEPGLDAVRPAPKTLMDLIQEDFPTSPSPIYSAQQQESTYHERPRTASPPSHYNRSGNSRYEMEQQGRLTQRANSHYGMENLEQVRYGHRDEIGNYTHSMDRTSMNTREAYGYDKQDIQYVLQPQRSDAMGRDYAHDPRAQGPVYASTSNIHPHGQMPPQQPRQYYQSQQVYYGDAPQPRNVAPTTLQAQILPSGQTVYVNAPAYGYSSAQYHPGAVPQHQQHHRIIHHAPQPMQGGLPPHEQYIAVIPVQSGPPGQMAQVSSPSGYGYWQQSDVPTSNAQTMSPTPIYAHTTPRSMSQVTMDSPGSGGRRPQQKNPRSPNDKSGATRRGGRGRRGGTEKHPTGGAAVSPLLEEFRASKSRDWSIIDIKGHVVEFCQDQNGSRFIQQRLEVGDLKEKQIVVTEVLPEVQYLRNDVFGNYVVQKLLEFGTPEMRADLRDTLKGEMLALSLQMYGCRVVQKALEMLDEDDLPRLLLEFHHNVLSCIQDQNGNHVIQKCVEVTSKKSKAALEAGDEAKAEYFNEQIDFIIDDVLSNTASLSCHPYGCRVLQRILEHCVEPKKTRTLDEIKKCHRQLLDDQYGNYVIQHVLQYGRHSDRDSLLDIVTEGGILSLSKQKFASNVVEKLLKYGNAGQRNAIVRELLKKVDEHTGAPMETGGTSVVLLMVRDAYANYVVQTALDVVPEGEEKRLLMEELTSHSAQLRNYTFAKHIVTKLGA